MKLSIIIPAYNEEKTIKQVIDEIPKKIQGVDEIQVIVIDDCSNDKTAEIAKNIGALVFSFNENKGLSKAISFGFSKAIEDFYQYVSQLIHLLLFQTKWGVFV